ELARSNIGRIRGEVCRFALSAASLAPGALACWKNPRSREQGQRAPPKCSWCSLQRNPKASRRHRSRGSEANERGQSALVAQHRRPELRRELAAPESPACSHRGRGWREVSSFCVCAAAAAREAQNSCPATALKQGSKRSVIESWERTMIRHPSTGHKTNDCFGA